ncbi:MAG: FAD-binding protein [Gemmatimonadales bacterium]|nr:FAD-binding protein [Gemmatimonadales bacterium]NIN11075.1 FAD-binding protein [Gemmatimonadales bacterium]NIN49672.1 FAD-binding protein [Gemmatimonadales bacterium]NIP07136.1 FAD-binding protein [Gemmatimonadales bacterium]NIQ99527.1 FAD-binding protein [Gemmatimonadales bacterium]
MRSRLTPPEGFRGRFLTERSARAAYSEGAGPYRILPSAVAIPADCEDVVRLVRFSAERGWPLVPRGAGSGMAGGNVGQGIILDLQELDSPLRISPDETAEVGAAVTWGALDSKAEPLGLRLAPNPASGTFCTIGGMVATNAAGARSVRAGSIRPWVRSLDLVTSDGEVVQLARRDTTALEASESQDASFPAKGGPIEQRFSQQAHRKIVRSESTIRRRFPATRKNSSGYALDAYLHSGDLVDLVIGSEGTLGVITRVELTLEARPPAVAGLLLAVDDLAGLGEVAHRLLTLDPAAVELLDQSFLALTSSGAFPLLQEKAAVLLVDFERSSVQAAEAAVDEAVRLTSDVCSYAESALSDEEHARLWALRHAASPALATLPDNRRSLQIIEDGCVPVPHLGEYLSGVRAAAQDAGIDIAAFGHAGDGHLHVNAVVDTTVPEFEERLLRLFWDVTQLVTRLGGTPSGEHGDGRLRAAVLEHVYGSEIMELFRLVKRVFDPAGIMNPGVVIPDSLTVPIANLKVGSRAAAIPADVARGLRKMEHTGGWGASKLELLAEGKAQ